ncbi:MAG TPA: CoA-binding protein [Mucilaginibacter sp.]
MPDNYTDLLKNTRTILLVDWPSTELPLALLKAGFEVYSYSPDNYSKAELNRDGKLNFVNLKKPPASVDIVNIFRPEEEHNEIIAKHVVLLGAKGIWLHPPVMSSFAGTLAKKLNLGFIEGINIADAANGI